MKTFDLDDVLTFGKYQGVSIRDVALMNPGYLAWMVGNVGWATLTDRAWNFAVSIGMLESEDAADRFGTAGDWGFDEF